MKYLIVGGGAMGSVLAAYMTRAGKDVTLITRGQHLETIRKNGSLELHYRPTDTTYHVPVKVANEDEYDDAPDVIILAVKAYSLDSVYPFLDRVSRPETVILPLLNTLSTGQVIAANMLKPATVAQGVAYVACERVEPGRCTHKEDFFRIVFGPYAGGPRIELANAIRDDLLDTGCTVDIADNMLREGLLKFARVSVGSGVQVYFRSTNAEIMADPIKVDFMVAMVHELEAVAEAAGCPFPSDFDAAEHLIELSAKVDPKYKTSLMYDFLADRQTEWRTMFLEPYELGRSLGVDMPCYGKVVELFETASR